ncbi:MAG: hypothetical protein Q9221_008100 [Calogaya cf. arnoldii]
MEPIAIIGFALKFPQEAVSPGHFWKMLLERRCAMTEFPPSRMNVDAFYDQENSAQGTIPLRGGHFIRENLGAFDASFFSMTPTEAAAMDPSQRILLETAYLAFEAAGISLERASGTHTSVHTGCFTDDYKLQLLKDTEQIPKYAATGASLAMLANRLSWFFNLSGPSMNIDSACSSSAIAIDHACALLRAGDCEMSLVAGCNLTYVHDYTSLLSKMSFLSPDSRCYAFDERANGYARGEGIGVVILKRLSDAVRDRNTIRAVLRSSASNQDAHTPGITQPSTEAQENLIRETYRKAGLSMEHTRFVEAHGTGTKIGDTVEIDALGGAFRAYRTPEDPLYVGAVKSNLGHLEGASGIAGLIKSVLILENGIIPPNANFEHVNHRIDADHLRVSFPVECMPWPGHGLRRLSINSFGFGGSNCHMVLDDAFNYLRIHEIQGIHRTLEYPPESHRVRADFLPKQDAFPLPNVLPRVLDRKAGATTPFRTPKLLVFSASDKDGTKRIAKDYDHYFSNVSQRDIDLEAYLDNVTYTLDSCRSLLPWRSYVVLDSITDTSDLVNRLSAPVHVRPQNLELGYVFSGQGAQWYAMGRELLIFPVFAASIERASRYINSLGCVWSVKDELLRGKADSKINHPCYSQSLCTILQMALVDLLRSVCIKPAAVLGHSSGEIAAAVNQAHGLPKLSISCFNSPRNITISGQENQISTLETILNVAGIFNRKLRVSIAYHSVQMSQVAEEYLALMGTLFPGCEEYSAPMISSVDGRSIDPKVLLQGKYWVQNMEAPVRFHDAMRFICSQSIKRPTEKLDGSHRRMPYINHLVEIGPSAVLHAPVMDCLKEHQLENSIACSSVLQRDQSATHTFLGLVGHLHGLGAKIDLRRVNDPYFQPGDDRIALSDLPGYPFNHDTTYWHESRLSSDRRLRKHGHVELLGTPFSDWNPLDAQWRNVINDDGIPWVLDHQISGACLCPGAAMIAMALEAASQLADPEQRILGFELSDVVFGVALDLSGSELNLETRFSLRSSNGRQRNHCQWSTFSVYSLIAQRWTEHCTGSIRVCYHGDSEDGGSQSWNLLARYHDAWFARKTRCTRSVPPSTMYQFLHKRSINYGPAFQQMRQIWCSDDQEVIADIGLYDAGKDRASGLHVIHPATLDAVMHSVFAAQSRGGVEDIATQVPSSIRRLWIASEGLYGSTDESILVSTSVITVSPLTVTSSSIAFDQRANSLQILIEGLEMSHVDTSVALPQSTPGESQVWCRLQSFVDIDLLTNSEVLHWLNEICTSVQEEPVDFYNRVRSVLRTVVDTKKTDLSITKGIDNESHMGKYLEWMDWQRTKDNNLMSQHHGKNCVVAIERDLSSQGPIGRLYSEIANKLDDILTGQADARQLLFDDGLVKGFYDAHTQLSTCFAKFQSYLAANAVKRPEMKILEVGAGTGVFTKIVLEALSGSAHDQFQPQTFSEYHFTDISPAFFEAARTNFFAYNRKMKFRVMDIEKDIDLQAQGESPYDIIIAANVLHITKRLACPLQNLRKLLKKDGKLIIHETTTPNDITTGFIFGLLPEWWQATEPNRKYSPLVTEHEWNAVLKETGFSGTDVVLQDFEHEACHQSSIMVSTAVDSNTTPLRPVVPAAVIVVDQGSGLQCSVARNLQKQLHETESCSVDILSMRDASTIFSKETVFIMLIELDSPFLQRLDQPTFSDVQAFLRSSRRVLWTTGGGGSASKDPGYGLVDGFARALRLENNNLTMVTLALEPCQHTSDRQVGRIFQILKKTFLSPGNSNYETEYIEASGALHVRRVTPAHGLRHDMLERLSRKRLVQKKFHESAAICVKTLKPGDLDNIVFEAQKSSEPLELGEDEIEIEVKAIGLGATDLSQAIGVTQSVGYGNQCAGVVSRVGSNATDRFRLGQRVCTLGVNLCQPYVRSNKDLVASVADDLTLEEASTLPYDLWLGSYLIEKIARVAVTDAVLIHGAASALGRVCLGLLEESKASVFATITSEEDRNSLQQRFLISKDHIFMGQVIPEDLKETSFGKGFDVILNVSSENEPSAGVGCLAAFGRFVYLISPGLVSGCQPVLPGIQTNITISAVDPTSLSDAYRFRTHRPLQQISDRITPRYLEAPVVVPHQISEMAGALRHLKEQHQHARTIVCLDKEDQVTVTMAVEDQYMFDANATYLISGGLGGLGRCIARWMGSRGARYLVLLSRSGPQSTAAHDMIGDLTSQGIRVETPQCDAADLEALTSTVAEITRVMPPIRGCIQAAGAIQDTWFDNMSFEDWNAATRPKVAGSWNLHSVLPRGLDFFILTASISGIFGQITQVNYASGNTYQDALARYRHARGEKAVSLDLGLLLIDGLLKDKPDLVKRLNSTGYFVPLGEPEILAIFDHYCDPSLHLASVSDIQPIVGIQSPAVLRSQGIELPTSMQQPLWNQMTSFDSDGRMTTANNDEEIDLISSAAAANTTEEAATITTRAITDKIAKIMSIAPEKLDIGSPIHSFGVDSLTAVDVRNWISKTFAVQISTFEILGNNSLTELGLAVARKLAPQDSKMEARSI